MKLGMSRSEARTRIESGEFDWNSLEVVMRKAHGFIREGREPSRINSGLSLASSFNILWRSIHGLEGVISPEDQIGAINILRDFGESRIKPRLKLAVHCYHEDLVEI